MKIRTHIFDKTEGYLELFWENELGGIDRIVCHYYTKDYLGGARINMSSTGDIDIDKVSGVIYILRKAQSLSCEIDIPKEGEIEFNASERYY